MKFEDLKQDSFIKWSADRTFKAWNTFGKVIAITEDEVTVMTYDDFKKTKLGKGGVMRCFFFNNLNILI